MSFINRLYENWLTRPIDNASGRLGLYRIIFSLYYLILAQDKLFGELARIPAGDWTSAEAPLFIIKIFDGINNRPPAFVFTIAEYALIAGLVFLFLGYRTKVASIVIILAGTFLFAFVQSFGKISHGIALYSTYIPAIMFFSCWGDTYSIESYLKKRRGETTLSPYESSWIYAWPIQMMHLVLAILFMSSGYIKFIEGNWIRHQRLFQDLLLRQNLRGAIQGSLSILNQFNATIASQRLLMRAARYIGIAFEFFFPLSLINRWTKDFFICSAIFFHSFNGIFLHVGFVPILIYYAVFVDWQYLYDRTLAHIKIPLNLASVSNFGIEAGTFVIIVLATAIWKSLDLSLVQFFTNGVLIWYMILPVASIWMLTILYRLFLGIVAQFSRLKQAAPSTS